MILNKIKSGFYGVPKIAAKMRRDGDQISYSAKACPWDDACIESFQALIKREWISRFQILDYSHAYRIVFEYIEDFFKQSGYTAIVDTSLLTSMGKDS